MGHYEIGIIGAGLVAIFHFSLFFDFIFVCKMIETRIQVSQASVRPYNCGKSSMNRFR